MRMLYSSTLAFFSILILVGCNTGSDDKIAKTQAPAPVKITTTTNILTGEWKYSNTIWYGEELTLDDNGTFKYHSQNCFGHTFTEGNWANSGGSVFLSSFDRYKTKNGNSEIINVSNQRIKKKKRFKKGEAESYIFSLKQEPIPNLPGPNDTSAVYFNNVKLNLQADTLYCADNNKFIGEHKFSRIKSIR